MVQNPPEGYQRVIPYLYYNDTASALDFLCAAFGFEERMRMPRPDGRVMHAEVVCGNDVIMLGTPADEDRPALDAMPMRHGGVMCYIDDVDAHYAKACEAGAVIVSELQDKFYGDRMYSAADIEGHHWHFATHVKDVSLEELTPPDK